MYRCFFRVSLSSQKCIQYSLPQHGIKPLQEKGKRVVWALPGSEPAGLCTHWSLALQIFCGSSALHSRENFFFRSGKARRARQKKVRECIKSELWEKGTALMMGRILHNQLGSSRLRSLPVEPGKHWFWISWENRRLGSVQVSSAKGPTVKSVRHAFYIHRILFTMFYWDFEIQLQSWKTISTLMFCIVMFNVTVVY